jgi:thioesterase domain-containing protein/aryl carrier-like protein
MLDACIHILAHPKLSQCSKEANVYLPARLERFIIYRHHHGIDNWFTHVKLRKWEPEQLYYDIDVADRTGRLICSFRNLLVRKHSFNTPQDNLVVAYDYVFAPCPISKPISLETSDLARTHGLHQKPQHWITYEAGTEMDLQAHFSSLDTASFQDVYVVAQTGRAGHLALGLCASLRAEFIRWRIRLILLEPSLVLSDLKSWIPGVLDQDHPDEDIVWIGDDMVISTPRLVRLAPLGQEPLQKTIQTFRSDCISETDHLLVKAIDVYMYKRIFAFVGTISRSQDSEYPVGSLVAGITHHQVSRLLVVPRGTLVIYPRIALQSAIYILALVMASFTAGTSRLLFPDRIHPPHRLAIHLYDKALADLVERTCLAIPSFPKPVTPAELDSTESMRINTILTERNSSLLGRSLQSLTREGKILRVDDLLYDMLDDDPWILHLTLERGIALANTFMPYDLHNPEQDTNAGAREEIRSRIKSDHRLFVSTMSYLVLGGIGGIGIDLAVWMYQHGARCIYLTSRRGLQTLEATAHEITMLKIKYLENLADLDIHFEACDATDLEQTRRLLKTVRAPLGGCFLLTMQLRDALFVNQTSDSFKTVLDSKIKPIEVLKEAVDIRALDFVLAFSSVAGLFGNPGQTNYAAACTALNGILAPFANAASIIVPAIMDSGYLLQSHDVDKHAISGWGMTSEDLFTHVANAVNRLRSSTYLMQYIPDLHWHTIASQVKLPQSCRYLVNLTSQEKASQGSALNDNAGNPFEVILDLLELSREEFDPDQPLTVYGLDSISATRISRALRPFGIVTPMSLLSNDTWNQIQQRFKRPLSSSNKPHNVDLQRSVLDIILGILNVSEEELSPVAPLSSYGLDSRCATQLSSALRPYIQVSQMQLLSETTWESIRARLEAENDMDSAAFHNESSQVLLPLSNGVGTPVLFLHDLSGSISAILPLRNNIPSPLWAIQITPTINFDSLENLISEYHRLIKTRIPHGPYHIATFSASSILGVALAKRMEMDGDVVVELSFVDHFPAFWLCRPAAGFSFPDSSEDFEIIAKEAARRSILNVIDLLRWDENPSRARYADELDTFQRGESPSQTVKFSMETIGKLVRLNLQFLLENARGDRSKMDETFLTWLTELKAPMSVFIASRGIVQCVPEWARDEWRDLGANNCLKPVRVHYLDAGHFEIMELPELGRLLFKERQPL